MPISKANALFSLIRSMSKSEKRSFALYVKKIQGGEQETQFFQLFKILEPMEAYQEEEVLQKLRPLSKSQLVNLRRHLYQHLCTSLRLGYLKKRTDTQIRELIDYAEILYGKGLYLQALQLLHKAKGMAKGHHLDLLHLEVLEFEKRIEFRHITRSLRGHTGTLTQETNGRASVIAKTIELSNLALELQGGYIQNGQAQNEQEADRRRRQLGPSLPALKHTAAQRTFFEKIYLYQAYFWYAFQLNDLEDCHYYINMSLHLFERFPAMKKEDTDMYMRLLHQDLSISFQKGESVRLKKRLQTLAVFFEELSPHFNANSRQMGRLYLQLAGLNQFIISEQYTEALPMIKGTLRFINQHQSTMDPHRVMVLYYKIAGIYIGSGQSHQSISYLTTIINNDGKHLRADIQVYSRILFLMAHFDLQNFDVLEFLCPQFERFFRKQGRLNVLQRTCFDFLKQTYKLPKDRMENRFLVFHNRLTNLRADPFSNRSFAYLNALYWVEQKIT